MRSIWMRGHAAEFVSAPAVPGGKDFDKSPDISDNQQENVS
jgi:hypothetical protein